MTVYTRIRSTIISAIMMAAVVVSFAGPSIASTVRLLDDDGVPAASETHLPLDTAAAPDPVAEYAPESAETDGSLLFTRDQAASFGSSGGTAVEIPFGPSAAGDAPCGQALLCVYRL